MNILKNFKWNKRMEETKDTEIPNESIKIVFGDLMLQIKLGQWLNVLKPTKTYSFSGISISTGLEPEELIKKVGVSGAELELVAVKFGRLLKMTGIKDGETCVFSDYNEKEFSFNCHLEKANEDCKIYVRWGDLVDEMPEVIIDTVNTNRHYDYHEAYKDNPAKLTLQSYTLKKDNGNELYRYISPYDVNYTLRSADYTLRIEMKNPKDIPFDEIFTYKYSFAKEKELEEYLLGLSFPMDIFEVYRKIHELDTTSIADYPKFIIGVSKKIDGKREKTTDKVLFESGALKELTKTQNGKTISIDSLGAWSYETSSLTVVKNGSEVKYNLTLQSEDELKDLTVPVKGFETVKSEIEQVRVLARTLERDTN
ncbi:MAG: hypothetical protein NC483_06340 [Ruminococcus sp.]|nr:hypothetical protein [Ruminococcus sp.]